MLLLFIYASMISISLMSYKSHKTGYDYVLEILLPLFRFLLLIPDTVMQN